MNHAYTEEPTTMIIEEIPEPKKPTPEPTVSSAERGDQPGERRCRGCGDPIADAPAGVEMCIECETEITGGQEQ